MAIVYEAFSKLRGGKSGKQTESFLRIVIVANDDLQNHIVIESISNIKIGLMWTIIVIMGTKMTVAVALT